MKNNIYMDSFVPRPYQIPICNAIEKKGFKKLLVILPRRAGKDIVAWNLMIRQAISKVGNYYYCLPTFKQARLVIWESITNNGKKFIDYIPEQLIDRVNQSEMSINLINGSNIRLIGSDTFDTSLVGTNPRMIVFSEYGLSDNRAYTFIRPILNANDGICLLISTPRGKNHMYDLYKIAEREDDWFCYLLTLDDTKHISEEAIKKEIESGEVSEDLAQQEYWCFPEDQEVLLFDKIKKIKDIETGDIVISHTGRPRVVKNKSQHKYKGDLIEILSYGSSEKIRCTPEHRIRIYNPKNQSYVWKPAKEITKNDLLVFPKLTLLNRIPIISYELCMLLAWYITEGSSFNNGIQFSLGNQNEIARVSELLIKLGIEYHILNSRTSMNIVIYNTQLVDFLKTSCGSISYDKKIPFNLISSYEKDFFYELMKGDGCEINTEKEKGFRYATVSKNLAYQVQLLAHSINDKFACGIYIRKANKSFIEDRLVNNRESYNVQIRESFKTRKKGGVDLLIRGKNCVGAKIREIKTIPFDGEVYNFSVQYDESYLIFGRAVHNCSFDSGIEGSIYGKYVDKMRMNGQITYVPAESNHKVFTSWDIGVHDLTTILFYQVIGSSIRIIDYYENSNVGLEVYIRELKKKAEENFWVYGKHIGPHDLRVREWAAGAVTRLDKARQLGLNFTLAPNISIEDGIEAVRSSFVRMMIDESKCSKLIKSMELYKRDRNKSTGTLNDKPTHDIHSHRVDALRYLCVSLSKIKDDESPEDVDKRFKEVMWQGEGNLPPFFR